MHENRVLPVIRFPEFKGSWEFKKLRDLAKIERGRFSPRPRNDPKFYGGDIPFVQTNDVTNSSGSISNYTQTLNSDGLKVSKFFPAGTILITIAANIGYSGVLRIGMACPDSLIGISCYDKTYNEYLCAYLNNQQPKMSYLAPQAAQKNINIEFLNPYPINIPTYKEQQKIANFLSSVDKKIQQFTEKQSLLQQYKKGIMQKLFSQEIRFKDEQGNDFPDWEEKSLAEVLTPKIREVNKPSEKYLAIGIRSHMKGTFQKPGFDPDDIAMEKLFVLKENDLVVNITFAWEGAIAIVKPEDDGGLVSHRFPTYTFKKDQATHEFFRHIIMQKRFKYMLDVISPGGAGRNRVLSKKEFLKLKWTLPSVAEQNKIALFLGELDKKIDFTRQQIEQTKTFKKGLLQQMFV